MVANVSVSQTSRDSLLTCWLFSSCAAVTFTIITNLSIIGHMIICFIGALKLKLSELILPFYSQLIIHCTELNTVKYWKLVNCCCVLDFLVKNNFIIQVPNLENPPPRLIGHQDPVGSLHFLYFSNLHSCTTSIQPSNSTMCSCFDQNNCMQSRCVHTAVIMSVLLVVHSQLDWNYLRE